MVSLFSGAGGLDLGLESVGFETLVATDVDEHSCRTLAIGKGEARVRGRRFLRSAGILKADVRDLSSDEILRTAGLKKGELDLLAGGPPCQAFSVFGQRKGREDPRGMLAFQYLRILADLQPRSFVFENVYGLLSIEAGAVFADLVEKLAEPARGMHYELSIHRLNAVDFGVPQYRDRVFIIGHRDGARVGDIPTLTAPEGSLFSPTNSWRTVADALRGLPPMGAAFPANHVGRNHSQAIVSRYRSLKPGERDPKTRINKLDLERPSFTIIVGSDKGGGKGHVHPTEPREVTPRESARIQTFPDWWAFSGTSRHPIRQIGNAVPPLLAAAVGNEIRAQLFRLPRVPFEAVLSRLDQTHLFQTDLASAKLGGCQSTAPSGASTRALNSNGSRPYGWAPSTSSRDTKGKRTMTRTPQSMPN